MTTYVEAMADLLLEGDGALLADVTLIEAATAEVSNDAVLTLDEDGSPTACPIAC